MANHSQDTFALWQQSVAHHIQANQGKRLSNLPTRQCGVEKTLFAVPTHKLAATPCVAPLPEPSLKPLKEPAMKPSTSSRVAVQQAVAKKTKQVQKNNNEAIQKTFAVFLPFLKRKRAMARNTPDAASFTMEDFKFEIAKTHPDVYALTCQSNGFWGAFTHTVKELITPIDYTRSKSPVSRHVLRVYLPNMFD